MRKAKIIKQERNNLPQICRCTVNLTVEGHSILNEGQTVLIKPFGDYSKFMVIAVNSDKPAFVLNHSEKKYFKRIVNLLT